MGAVAPVRWSAASRPAIVGFVNRLDLDDLIRKIRTTDPDLVAAADEVDRDLLEWFASLPLDERLARATSMGATLEELRRARTAR